MPAKPKKEKKPFVFVPHSHRRRLTSEQVRGLAILRSKAHQHQRHHGLTDLDAATWNAREMALAFRDKNGQQDARTSLSQATQNDYAALRAWFHALNGEEAEAEVWRRKDTSGLTATSAPQDTPESRRQQIHLLRETCQEYDLAFPQYPLGVARKMNPTEWHELEDVPAAQLHGIRIICLKRGRKPTKPIGSFRIQGRTFIQDPETSQINPAKPTHEKHTP